MKTSHTLNSIKEMTMVIMALLGSAKIVVALAWGIFGGEQTLIERTQILMLGIGGWVILLGIPVVWLSENSWRLLLLPFACVAVLVWQSSFLHFADDLDQTYRLRASSGLKSRDTQPFLYFLYYLDLFPVATTHTPLIFSVEGAQTILHEHPETLRMETTNVIRTGDFGRFWLYLPDVFLQASPKEPSVRPMHASLFTASLLLLLIAAWYSRQIVLGVLLVLLIGSHPFQLFEVYGNENVFSWPISTAVLTLALHFPLIMQKPLPRILLWAIPILSGVVLATIRQIRTEPVIMIVAILAVYSLAFPLSWRTRVALCLLCLGSFSLTSKAWEISFESRFAHAQQIVAYVGGEPLPGNARLYHTFWHSIWCGLGDFDTRYGYTWDDRVGYAYADPILRSQGALDFTMMDYVESTATHDPSGYYYKLIWEIPGYEIVMRDKVLSDIGNDPVWYGSILMQRIERILTEVAPLRLAVGGWWLTIPTPGYLVIPMAVLLILLRRWPMLLLLFFSLPLATTALVVYSGRGTTYYTVFLHIAAAIGITLFWEWIRQRYHHSFEIIDKTITNALTASRRKP